MLDGSIEERSASAMVTSPPWTRVMILGAMRRLLDDTVKPSRADMARAALVEPSETPMP
jgi:hypothetical protein